MVLERIKAARDAADGEILRAALDRLRVQRRRALELNMPMWAIDDRIASVDLGDASSVLRCIVDLRAMCYQRLVNICRMCIRAQMDEIVDIIAEIEDSQATDEALDDIDELRAILAIARESFEDGALYFEQTELHAHVPRVRAIRAKYFLWA